MWVKEKILTLGQRKITTIKILNIVASKFIEFLKENNALLKFVNCIKTLSPHMYQRVKNDDPEKVVEAFQELVDLSLIHI